MAKKLFWGNAKKETSASAPSQNAADERVDAPVEQAADETPVVDPASFDPKSRPEITFSTILSDYDFYLLGEGKHWQSYEKLGAQFRVVDGVEGVNFLVWAPNATRVAVVGDFNDWDGYKNPMVKHYPSGLWETFVPGVREGAIYKYRVERDGVVTERADPYGFYAEVPPRTASVVADLDKYEWQDGDWMTERAKNDVAWLRKPMSVYEVHLGSWIRSEADPERLPTYRELADQLVDYVKKLGYTHVEFLPVSEHPLTASWGYQVIGMYAVTSRYGRPEDFMYLVDKCHQNGIGVILDWVPAHFPKDAHGLRRFDGGALYEHEDPRQGEHRDWGTLIFNYGRNEVRNYLISNALFWLDKYHVDGLRVDAVASMLYLDYSRPEGEWVPNERGGRENLEAIAFLQEMNVETHGRFPGVLTIAEESTAWAGVCKPVCDGGLGFSMKWNMGWMNDTLRYCKEDPIYRKYHHDQMTFSLMYAFSENFVLPISHDEVVHGKGTVIGNAPGDLWQKFALARLLYSYMWAHPGKKLLFMGAEIGQWKEWNFDAGLDWELLRYDDTHGGLQRCITDLNRLYREEKAFHDFDFDGRGFEWISCGRWEESLFVFMRKAEDWRDHILVAANFTPVPRRTFIGVPERVDYQEIFCSDSPYYGGSGVGNGARQVIDSPCDGRPWAIEALIPPLGASFFKPIRVAETVASTEAKKTKDGAK
ncbi:MAG: 1,4-alpha-glucan branching protein GlgB [Thermoguttaceae bacterium]|nr:1,4-alpha-glucan branching protein GlgB [Thermoguttaceae bacterium]